MATEVNKDTCLQKEVENLVTNMDGRLCVSMVDINWAEAGKVLKWATLLKLALGRVLNKERI